MSGHENNISCTAKTQTGSYCISGDQGERPHLIIVWSVYDEQAIQTIRNPHDVKTGRGGVDQVGMSADDKLLFSLGGVASDQSVCVWDWKDAPESPLAIMSLKSGKIYNHLTPHPCEASMFLVTSKTTCLFFNYDDTHGELLQCNPGSVDKEFGRSSGHLTTAIFIRYTYIDTCIDELF